MPSIWRHLRYRLLPRPLPSGGPSLRHPAPVRLLALLACRNEMRYLPGYIANVAPQVDGIVALDDGSTDGSAEYLAGRPEVVELLRVSPDRPEWDESGNHRALYEAAVGAGADWAVTLDADERVEREFRDRAERVIHRWSVFGLSSFAVILRELWGSPGTYRADGIWGGKTPGRLCQVRADAQLDTRPLHVSKVPMSAGVPTVPPRADLLVYHLRMVDGADRQARRERYERLDPTNRWQPREGYAYLTDETGLELRSVPPERGYDE